MDRRLLSLVRGSDTSRHAHLVPAAAEAVLLVEFETDSPARAQHAARDLVAEMMQDTTDLLNAAPAFDGGELERFWQLRETALPRLYGQKVGPQPLPFIEDIGVPLESLPEFMRRAQDILQEHEITASFLIHACTGQVHTRPFFDLQKPEDVSRLPALAENVHALALELGGTVSTQHGTGLARTPWVARQYGPLYPLIRQLKAIFDPKNIFNPGKIVDPEPGLASWPLRTLAPAKTQPVPLQLCWQPEDMRQECNHCNGCGQCRTEARQLRMCPVFRATHGEAASPRAKANLLRNLLQGANSAKELASDEVRAVADLCVNCKMCAMECPARVNIPKLMLEAKAANVAEHGLSRTDWFFSRLETWARLGSYFPLFTNIALRSFPLRWLVDKLSACPGGAACRASPTSPSSSGPTNAAGPPGPGRTSRCVALFVDLFANYFDPQMAEAAVAVLQHQGFDVYRPAQPDRLRHGRPGPGGRGNWPANWANATSALSPKLARDGMPIVCLEPTSALMLRQDLLDLIDNDDARIVAQQTVRHHAVPGRPAPARAGCEPTSGRIDVMLGHHVPCHVKALG